MNDSRPSVLGVPFDRLSMSEVLNRMESSCLKGEQLMMITPNPEMCLAAQNNSDFLNLLQHSELNIADGFGILWADRFLQGKKSIFRWLWTLLTPWITKKVSRFPERVTGTDVMKIFCKQYRSRKIFLLGASEEVNEQLSKQLISEDVNIVGRDAGKSDESDDMRLRALIKKSEAEVLFVAFGAPQQEFWLKRNLPQLPKICVGIGIGGAFDFLAGKRKRAPLWMRKSGLEWLFRVIIEPSRIRRIFRATVVFPWKVLMKSWE